MLLNFIAIADENEEANVALNKIKALSYELIERGKNRDFETIQSINRHIENTFFNYHVDELKSIDFITLVKSFPGAVVVINEAGNIKVYNKKAAHIFKIEQDRENYFHINELAGKDYFEQHILTQHSQENNEAEVDICRTDNTIAPCLQSINVVENYYGKKFYIVSLKQIDFKHQLKYFELIFKNAKTGLVIAKADGDNEIEFVNPAFEKITGYDKSEVVGKNCRFLQGKLNNQEAAKTIRKAIAEKTGCNVLLKNFKKDGTLFYNSFELVPVFNEHMKLINYIGIQNDVTEKLLIEEELMKSKIQLESIFETTNNGYCLMNSDKEIVQCNLQIFTILGIERNQKNLIGYLINHYLTEFNSPLNEEFELKKIVQTETGKHLEIAVTAVRKDHQKPDYLISIQDISEIIELKNEISQSQSQLQYIINNLDLAVLSIELKNNKRKIIFKSDNFDTLIGIQFSKAINDPKQLYPSISKKLNTDFENFANAIADKEEHKEFEIEINGNKKWLGISGRKTKSEKAERLDFIVHDITEKKQHDELLKAKELAEQSLEFKSNFLANLSHEIRNPLNGVVSMADLLASSDLGIREKEFAKVLKKSSSHLLLLINDVLDLSKIEAGKMTLNPSVFHFPDLVHNIVLQHKYAAEHKHLKLKYINLNAPIYIKADELKLIQILNNLVSNAIKYTPHGSIFVYTIVCGNQICINIEDTGIGISENDAMKMFMKYEQFSKLQNVQGSGLGLSISKKLVELMGGELCFDSIAGMGSTFSFNFNFENAHQIADFEHEKQELENHTESTSHFQADILLVDDMETNRQVGQLVLEALGCRVETASGGKEAIKKIMRNKYDLVLLDILMPDFDGIETINYIKKKFKKSPVIIALTANALEGDIKKYMQLGFDDVILKPIDIKKIKEKLSSYLFEKKSIVNVQNNFEKLPEIFDEKTLKSLYQFSGNNIELVQEIFKSFLNDAISLDEKIEKNLRQRQFDLAKKDIHSFKGLSSTIGARKMYDVLLELEENLKNQNYADIPRFYAAMKNYLRQIKSYYHEKFVNSAT
jgi:PAS domain S-box-containing protein